MPVKVGYRPSSSKTRPYVTFEKGGKIKSRHRTKAAARGAARAVNAAWAKGRRRKTR